METREYIIKNNNNETEVIKKYTYSYTTINDINEMSDEDCRIIHYKTGVPYIDIITLGGMHSDTINLFSGGTGSGKSLYLLHLALNVAKQGHEVYYLSLENSKKTDYKRLKEACKLYSIPETIKFHFLNTKKDYEIRAFKNDLKDFKAAKKGHIFVFIDAPEYLFDYNDTSSGLYGQGVSILNEFNELADGGNMVICMTWQAVRGATQKEKGITLDDLANSMAASRISAFVWAIEQVTGPDGKRTNQKTIKLIKGRDEYKYDMLDGKVSFMRYNKINYCDEENGF